MKTPLQRSALVVVLPLVMSCALVRPAPDSPLAPTKPAPAATVPSTEVPAAELVAPSRVGLAGARTILLIGWTWPAKILLAEVVVMARAEGDGVLEARSLVIQGVLAWESQNPGEAIVLFGAASAADPLGVVGRSARLTAEMIDRLGTREDDIAQLRTQLNSTRTGLQTSEEQARALEIEVDGLRRQLDELKQLHIQIESEKQDDPS